jgi:LCP family protein required for cell wall assembly
MSFGYVAGSNMQRRTRRRRGSSRQWFWIGFGIGFFGAASVVAVLVASFYILFPPTRLNILLLGLDRRPGESVVARTDTMILATINPSANYIGLLSIPRDLWVTLPDGSQNRINTAHFFAEAAAPGSGPQSAVDTVASNFGLTLNRYIRLDFGGFVRIIDSVGGITLDVEQRIVDESYPDANYGYEVLVIEPGLQHMDGELALKYARTRHGSSDFDRAKRQQAVIAAFGRRLLQPDAWPRLPSLLIAVQSSLDTNLTAVDVLGVLPTLIQVSPDQIDRQVIEGDLVQPFTTSGGAAVQLPVWERINPILFEMFGE